MKTCTKCGELKPLSEFHNCKANKDGKYSSCKKCENKRQKKYYLNNKPKIAKRQKEWRNNNSKEYYVNNKQKLNKRAQEWKDNNRKHVNKYAVNYRKDHTKQTAKNNRNWTINNRERRRKLNRKIHAKRRRDLGYKPINKKETGNVGHHMDKNLVIYIPEELHKSVLHAQSDIKSMKKINILAIQVAYI